VERGHKGGDGAGGRRGLSPRELAVLVTVTYGLTTKEIAARLGVSLGTVNYHLTNIYRKLGAHSRVQAMNAVRRLARTPPTENVANILEMGTRLAAEIASPPNGPRRAAYFLVEDGVVTPFIECDSLNVRIGRTFALEEHPFFSEIVASGEPRSGEFASRPIGPQVREIAAATGVTAGAAVPIALGGSLHGILAVGARGAEVSDALMRSLIDLGLMVEFALANADLTRPAKT
jgi:DNA-binding CsgD family transcriptional regulator